MLQWRSTTAVIAIVTLTVSAFILLFMNLGIVATYWGFTPAHVGVNLTGGIAIPWWLTPWTSALIHGGWLHLFVNMLMLLFLGSQVERVIGSLPTLFAYIIGALAAAVAQYAVEPNSVIPMVGASGAISALFGLYALFFGTPKQVTSNPKLNRWIHVLWLMVTWVLLQWMAAMLAGRQGILLATPAHIGGFIAGLLVHRPLLMWRWRKA